MLVVYWLEPAVLVGISLSSDSERDSRKCQETPLTGTGKLPKKNLLGVQAELRRLKTGFLCKEDHNNSRSSEWKWRQKQKWAIFREKNGSRTTGCSSLIFYVPTSKCKEHNIRNPLTCLQKSTLDIVEDLVHNTSQLLLKLSSVLQLSFSTQHRNA